MKGRGQEGYFKSCLMGLVSIFLFTCLSPTRLWGQPDLSELSSSEEPVQTSWDQDGAVIQGLGEIFMSYAEKEKSSFFEKWPVRLAGVAVRGVLPSAGISLFRPQDPWLKPTIGKSRIND